MIHLLLGAAAVLVHYGGRFATPPDRRLMTTAARYYTAMACYLVAVTAVYYVGVRSLVVVGRTEAWGPLLAALVFVTVLPRVPIVAAADTALRRRLLVLAHVPVEVLRLAALLRKTPWRPGSETRAYIEQDLRVRGLRPELIRFDNDGSVRALWTRLAGLVMELQTTSDERFRSRVHGRLITVMHRYERLSLNVAKVLTIIADQYKGQRSADIDLDRPVPADPVNELVAVFSLEVQALLNDVHWLLAARVLWSGRTQAAGHRELRAIGFEVEPAPPSDIVDRLTGAVTAAAAMALLVLALFVASDGPAPASALATKAAMILLIYVSAVWCAVYPKQRVGLANRDVSGRRPYVFYAVGALLSGVLAAVISLVFRTIIFGDFMLAAREIGPRLPWVLLAVGSTAMTAVMLDNHVPADAPSRWIKWSEGALQALGSVALALVVHPLLHKAGAPEIPSLPQLLLVTPLIGFSIGFTVPTWYRGRVQQIRRDYPRFTPPTFADLQPL